MMCDQYITTVSAAEQDRLLQRSNDHLLSQQLCAVNEACHLFVCWDK